MVNKRRPRISAAAPVRRLFEYFHKMIKIHCNRCNAILSQQWEFIFINSDVFQFEVSISWCSFIQFSLQDVRVLQFLSEGCKLRRCGKPNLYLSHSCNCCSKEIVSVCLYNQNVLALWYEPFNKRRPRINTAQETRKMK